MRRFVITLSIFFLFLVTVDWGYCEESEISEPVYAIQEKVFFKYHELAFVTGYISNEDFHEVFPLGLAYTYNFDDRKSWEVFRFYYDFTMKKDLMKDLEKDYGVAPEQFYKPKAQLLTHFVYRPLYGKDAYLNKSVINHETFFFGGGGIEIYDKASYDSNTVELAFCGSFGAGIKYFINDSTNITFELRDLMSQREGKLENRIWFGISCGFRFNLDARKTYSDETLNKLTKYLEDE